MFMSLIFLALTTMSILMLIHLTRHYHKRYILWHWKQKYGLHQHEKLFEQLYQSVDGFALSKAARSKRDALEYVYGEIDFLSFIALMNLAKPNQETLFYDLGSGSDKAVIASAMVYEMKEYVGIELFHELYEVSVKQQEKLALLTAYKEKASRIHFIHDNFLNRKWSDATLVFINAAAFIGETWEQINLLLEQTQIGSQIITISKKLHGHQFLLKRETLLQMSWGVASAYLYEHTG